MPMADSLAELRASCAEPLPLPDESQARAAAQAVVDYCLADFAGLAALDPAATADRAAMESLLRQPPPEHGIDFETVLAELRDRVVPHNMRPHHPRFLAFVPAAPTFASVLGDWLCASTNVFAGVWKEAAAATEIELLVLDWFKELTGYPTPAGGLLTSGGSEANLTALVVAREQLSFEARRRACIYVSDQRHWSVDRAAKVIGLAPEQMRVLASADDFRLPPQTLAAAIADDRRAGRVPWLVVASAGTTNTGACDPLEPLAALCRSERLWLHADAAYGWPAMLSEAGRRELMGIAAADSITLDPHKWLGQTYDVGCLLVRNGPLLEQAFAIRPEYLQDVAPGTAEVNFADRGICLTRRFRALKIWMSLKVLGLGWFRALVEHDCRLARYAQALLEQQGCFEIVSPCRLSVLCFRFVSAERSPQQLDAINRALCDEVCRSGRAFLATTQLRGRTAQRFCFVNWRTTARDVEEVVGLLSQAAARCSSRIGCQPVPGSRTG